MSKIESTVEMSPFGDAQEMPKITIDTVPSNRIFSGIVNNVGMEHSFGAYVKPTQESQIEIAGEKISLSVNTWNRIEITFVPSTRNFTIKFLTIGEYLFFHSQLELGNACTDYVQAEEDTDVQQIFVPGTRNIDGHLIYKHTIAAEALSIGTGGNLYHTWDDFEQVTNDTIFYESKRMFAEIDESDSLFGSKCLKLKADVPYASIYLGTNKGYGSIPLIVGNWYIASCYVKSNIPGRFALFAVQKIINENREDKQDWKDINTDTEWKRVQFAFQAEYPFMSIRLYAVEDEPVYWVDGIMIEMVVSNDQVASDFKKGGTTQIIGDNIYTGAIMSRNYNGTDGDIDNTTGCVINLNGKGINYGGRFIYDQQEDKMKIKGDVSATNFVVKDKIKITAYDPPVYNNDGKLDDPEEKIIDFVTLGGHLALHTVQIGYKPPGEDGHSKYPYMEFSNDHVNCFGEYVFDKIVGDVLTKQGVYRTPIGSWGGANAFAVSALGVDSKGNVFIHANWNGDGETFTTRYFATTSIKPLT